MLTEVWQASRCCFAAAGQTDIGRRVGRMARRWWRAAAWVAVVVVVVQGLLTETRAEEEPTIKSFWPPQKGKNISLEGMFRTPAEKAAKNLHQLLVGSKDTRAGLESVLGTYLPTINPAVVKNMKCIKDVVAVLQIMGNENLAGQTYSQFRFWPMTLSDSWGKVPDGILFGNIMPWGMLEECTAIRANEHYPYPEAIPPIDSVFRGRYCLVSVGNTKTAKRDRGVLEELQMTPEVRIAVAMTDKRVPPIFSYGTCMPSSCTDEDLRVSIDSILNPVGREAMHVDCQVADEPNDYNAGDITFIVILCVLGALMLFAAAVDLFINYYDSHELRKGPLKFVLVFSAYSNLKATFAIKPKEHPDVITCLHGLRVFTMVWVVWGHGYMIQLQVTHNLMYYKQLSEGVINQIIMNASYSVDTFLFMSGLLVAYNVLLEKERTKRINWIMYYVHRFFRLSPPIMFTAAAVATVFRYSMDGPYAIQIEKKFVQACRDNWWADSFFVANLIKDKMCLPQCWYTAVDFQLFVFAPLVVAPLLSRNILSLVWLALVTLASVAVPVINIAVYNLTPPGLAFGWPLHALAQVDLYTKPWARGGPYLAGVWAAWLLVQVRGKNFKLHPVAVVLGWLASAAIALVVLFGMADYNYLTFPLNEIPKDVSIAYGGLSRLAWGVSLMWVVFACHTGYGGIMNSILSHPSLQPLSRLTYSLFLVTIPIQVFYMGAIFTPLYVNHLNKIIETCGYLFIGGLIGIPLTLAVERPILGLEKILLPRPGRAITEHKEEEEKKEQ